MSCPLRVTWWLAAWQAKLFWSQNYAFILLGSGDEGATSTTTRWIPVAVD